MLTSAALVLLMTPGLAFFYGGMVRAKSVLNMMMMSFGALGVVSVAVGALRLLAGVRQRRRRRLVGNLDFFGLDGLLDADRLGGVADGRGIPPLAFVGFQLSSRSSRPR